MEAEKPSSFFYQSQRPSNRHDRWRQKNMIISARSSWASQYCHPHCFLTAQSYACAPKDNKKRSCPKASQQHNTARPSSLNSRFPLCLSHREGKEGLIALNFCKQRYFWSLWDRAAHEAACHDSKSTTRRELRELGDTARAPPADRRWAWKRPQCLLGTRSSQGYAHKADRAPTQYCMPPDNSVRIQSPVKAALQEISITASLARRSKFAVWLINVIHFQLLNTYQIGLYTIRHLWQSHIWTRQGDYTLYESS